MNYKLYGDKERVEIKIYDELKSICYTIDFDKKSALDIANYITNNFKEEKED